MQSLFYQVVKTLWPNFWSSYFQNMNQKSLFRVKNPGRLQVIFFQFVQRPKVSSIIIVTIENMKHDVLSFRMQETTFADEWYHVSL